MYKNHSSLLHNLGIIVLFEQAFIWGASIHFINSLAIVKEEKA